MTSVPFETLFDVRTGLAPVAVSERHVYISLTNMELLILGQSVIVSPLFHLSASDDGQNW